MNLHEKKLSDFQPIKIDEDQQIDKTIYNELSKLLKRVGRSEQKSAQISELLKNEITSKLKKYEVIIDEIREKNAKQKKLKKELQNCLLGYMSILDDFEKTQDTIADDSIIEIIEIARRKRKQIHDVAGIIPMPGVGSDIDISVHYVVETSNTDKENLDKTVKEVIEQGYRKGDEILRKSTIIGFKYGGNK